MKHLLLLFDGIHLEGGIPMALFYALFGFVFVFLGIILLVIILSVVGKIMSAGKNKKKSNKAPVQKTEESSPMPEVEEGISPETVAVISAAIFAIMGEGQKCDFIVRRIKRL